MLPALNLSQGEAEALLLAEGDRLASRLVQTFPLGVPDLDRAYWLGRSVVSNLVRAFFPTAETVTRRLEKPLSLYLSSDSRGWPEILAVNSDGEAQDSLPVEDLLNRALYRRGRLIAAAESELRSALYAANEHAATLALIRLFRLPCVLEASSFYLKRYAGRG